MATKRPSSFVCITRAGLTASVALGLTSVFAGGPWLFAALAAAIAPHALLAWADRRKLPSYVAIAMVLGGAFLFTLVAVEPHTTNSGIPTSETFSSYFRELRDAPHVLRTAVVPVVATGSALLLALVALWIAGAIAEWSGRRFDATLGALGPSLVLFVAIAAFGEGGWVLHTIVYAFAVGMYLLALHETEMTERRSWFHTATRHRSRVLQGGVLGAVAIVLVAAVVAPLLPGSRSTPWFDYRSLGDGSGGGLLKATTPIVSIQAKLLEDPEREVFTVDIGDAPPVYWRVIALDKYDGKLWTLEDSGEPAKDLTAPTEPRRARRVGAEVRHPRVGAALAPDRVPPGRDQPRERARRRGLGDDVPQARRRDQRLALRSDVRGPRALGGRKARGTARRSRPVRAVPRPPRRLPAERHGPRGAGHARRGHAVGAGRRDRALPEHGRRLRLQRPGRAFALDRHARGIPLRHARGVLRAVRICVRGDGAFDRSPDARRGRLLVRRTAERRLAREEQGRARLARGVLLRPRLGAARADARPRRQRAGRHGRSHPTAAGERHRRDTGDDDADHGSRRDAAAVARKPPGQPGRHLARSGRVDLEPAAQFGRAVLRRPRVRGRRAGDPRVDRDRRLDRARGAPHLAPPPRR